MSVSRILGILLVAVGIVFLGFGLNSSHTLPDRVSESATGRYTQHTMFYIIGGIVMIIGGGALFIGGRPKKL